MPRLVLLRSFYASLLYSVVSSAHANDGQKKNKLCSEYGSDRSSAKSPPCPDPYDLPVYHNPNRGTNFLDQAAAAAWETALVDGFLGQAMGQGNESLDYLLERHSRAY